MRQYYLYRVESYKYYYCFIFLCCGVAWKILKAEANSSDMHLQLGNRARMSQMHRPNWTKADKVFIVLELLVHNAEKASLGTC